MPDRNHRNTCLLIYSTTLASQVLQARKNFEPDDFEWPPPEAPMHIAASPAIGLRCPLDHNRQRAPLPQSSCDVCFVAQQPFRRCPGARARVPGLGVGISGCPGARVPGSGAGTLGAGISGCPATRVPGSRAGTSGLAWRIPPGQREKSSVGSRPSLRGSAASQKKKIQSPWATVLQHRRSASSMPGDCPGARVPGCSIARVPGSPGAR